MSVYSPQVPAGLSVDHDADDNSGSYLLPVTGDSRASAGRRLDWWAVAG